MLPSVKVYVHDITQNWVTYRDTVLLKSNYTERIVIDFNLICINFKRRNCDFENI